MGNLEQESIISEVFKDLCLFAAYLKGEKLGWGSKFYPESASPAQSGAAPPPLPRPPAMVGRGHPTAAAPAGTGEDDAPCICASSAKFWWQLFGAKGAHPP